MDIEIKKLERFAFLDTFLFPVCFFFFTESFALFLVDVYSFFHFITKVILSGAITVFLARKIKGRDANFIKSYSGPIIFVMASVVIFLIVGFTGPSKGEYHAGGWFPGEWRQAPTVWFNFFISLKGYSAPYFLLFIFMVYRQIKGHKWSVTKFSLVVVIICILYVKIVIPDDINIMLVMLMPLMGSIAFGIIGQHFIERRIATIGVPLVFALSNYVCMVPFFIGQEELPGLEKIFPTENQVSQIPTLHFRDLIVDEKENLLVISWGETSGLLRVDLDTGKQDVAIGSLIRYIEASPDNSTISGAGWHDGAYVEYQTYPLTVIRKTSLMQYGMGQLFTAKRRGAFVYVSSMEPPAFGKFDHETMSPLIIRDFRKEGLTNMPSGPAHFIIPADGNIYLSMNMVDVPNKFIFYVLEPDKLEVIKKIELPEHICAIEIDAKRDMLYLASYFTDKIFCIDLKTGKLIKSYQGLYHSRLLIYDTRRDVIYSGSYYTGEFAVINAADGEILIRKTISRRIQLGNLNQDLDTLYFNTTEGAYKLDLDTLEHLTADVKE